MSLRRSLELDRTAGVTAGVASRYGDVSGPGHARWMLIAVCMVSFTLLAVRMHQGLSPEGDRVAGYTADGIAAGGVPGTYVHGHGEDGLSFWRASLFRTMGIQLGSRGALFGLFAAWVPIFWSVAKRLASPMA